MFTAQRGRWQSVVLRPRRARRLPRRAPAQAVPPISPSPAPFSQDASSLASEASVVCISFVETRIATNYVPELRQPSSHPPDARRIVRGRVGPVRPTEYLAGFLNCFALAEPRPARPDSAGQPRRCRPAATRHLRPRRSVPPLFGPF
jgi:hypothetical protein